ncbi:QRFP-like peptide receptor isoform X1 [Paramacrobiotus metropolitanus]|uniref:QRFP-like peptide receptor isoform X1 n=1 Tax=Paramacrobiotus metropolitanus TaxID=2943436 RepID=UPI0024464AB8|nr:QRFP-like peptide receptor isoform X1 [Paramacrobiotus metropolitanus]
MAAPVNGSMMVNLTNASTTPNDNETVEHSGEMYPHYYLIASIATVLYAGIFIVGVIGNLLVCYVVAAYKDMRDNIFHIFLANLSIADLLVVAVCVPTAMVDVFSEEIWYLGEEMCRAVPFLEYSVTHLSVLTILAISFERFLAIIYPLKAQYLASRNRSQAMIIVIWGVAFVTSIPFALIPTYSSVNHSRFDHLVPSCAQPIDTKLKEAYMILVVVVFFVIPFFILLVLYAFISHHLIRDSYKTLGVTTDSLATNMRARKQVVIMLATVVGAFFVCLLPFRILSVWTIYADTKWYEALGAPSWFTLLYFARIMLYMNSACNPVVLYFMSTKFRTKFQHALCCRPLPASNRDNISRSGTFRYSVRTDYSGSLKRPDCGTQYTFTSSSSLNRRSPMSNGNGNASVTLTPIEELPML